MGADLLVSNIQGGGLTEEEAAFQLFIANHQWRWRQSCPDNCPAHYLGLAVIVSEQARPLVLQVDSQTNPCPLLGIYAIYSENYSHSFLHPNVPPDHTVIFWYQQPHPSP